MVLLSSPLKDNCLEYKNLLAFLNSEEQDTEGYADAHALAILRARFTRHVAYERKAGSSNFLEHWVPAYLSQVQLELYCSILLANSSVLGSQMTADSVGDLRDLILCLWECCDHPCLVDEFPQHLLVNISDVTESLDDRIRASGKLLVLEKMLKEIRNKRLRVIVLFQSDGAGGDPSMGNILEEFVHHRFGPESYERVRSRSRFSMRQAAMDTFNDMTKGRFVLLIENRACRSSINLSSIDAIIISGSNLNPLNDLKVLRRIKIESRLKYVRIFRLYTPFTVEEKGLMLAKQGMVIDSNSQDIAPSLRHCLLSWGVSFLFSGLDELQQKKRASKCYGKDAAFYMDKVISEFITALSTNVEDSTKVNTATMLKACMSGEFYSKNITDLIGEREGASSLDGDLLRFWLNLLGATRQNIGVENQSTPKSLRAKLKRELSKLTKFLQLPGNVCFLAKQLLEYLLKNYLVIQYPPGILDAFDIALCWRAASLLKYNDLDRRESLALAANCLNYECDEERAGFYYENLVTLEEKALHEAGERSNEDERNDHRFPKQAMALHHGNLINGGAPKASSITTEKI